MSCRQFAVIFVSSCYAAGLANAQDSQSEEPASTDQWEYCVTFAYPLSDKTEISACQTFSQDEGSSLSWSAVHLSLCHALTDQPIGGLSPSLLFDFERATDASAGSVLVSQLCLEHQRGRVAFTLAPLYEYSWAPAGVSLHCAGVDLLAFHAISNRLSAGIETHWKADLERSDSTVDDLYIVPAASLSSGSLSYSLGLAIGLNEGSGEPLVRFALGMSL